MPQSVTRPLFIASLLVAASSASSPAAEYESAQLCAACHDTIHLYWSQSVHATSASNPTFLASFETALEGASDAAEVRRDCLWCHAPVALVNDDYALEQPITREGVTCDFCHTVADVDMSKAGNPFTLDPGPVKRGPLEFAKSDFHQTAYSVLHKSSALLCASCHEWRNAQGVAVLSTWSEWQAGPYAARGQTCQECHMPMVPGETVSEGLTASQRRVNLHRTMGGSSAAKLRSGLDLDLTALSVTGSSASIQTKVTNTGVGHAVPGGLGNDQLVLVVGVDAGGDRLAHRQERVYQRQLRDADGKTLSRISDLFLRAASVGEDSRIGPLETRTERFTLPLPDGWRAFVARLEFRNASDPSAEPLLIMEERHGR